MIKKLLVFLTIITFSALNSFGEFTFAVSSNADNDTENHWVAKLGVNEAAKTLELSLKRTLMEFSFLLPIPKETVTYFDHEPIPNFVQSTKGFNYGGKEDELLFINNNGVIIFGIYVDPQESGNNRRHNGYIIVPGAKGVLQVVKTHPMNHSCYTQYAKLLEACKFDTAQRQKNNARQPSPSTSRNTQGTTRTPGSTASAPKRTQNNRATTQTPKPRQTQSVAKKEEVISYGSITISVLKNYNFDLKDAICKVFGKIEPSTLIDKDWNQIALTLKRTFGTEPSCNSNFYFYDYYCRNCKLLGVNLSQLRIRSNHDSYFKWEYSFEFKKKKDAKNFYRRLQAHVGSLGYKSMAPYKDIHETWYTQDICGNKEVYITVYNTKVERGLYIVSLETSVHLK